MRVAIVVVGTWMRYVQRGQRDPLIRVGENARAGTSGGGGDGGCGRARSPPLVFEPVRFICSVFGLHTDSGSCTSSSCSRTSFSLRDLSPPARISRMLVLPFRMCPVVLTIALSLW